MAATDRFQLETTFAYRFARAVTTDVEVLRHIYFAEGWEPCEFNLASGCLNILGTCFGSFVEMSRILMELEVEAEATSILRRNTLTSKVIEAFIARSCGRFLRGLLLDPLDDVVNDISVDSFEIQDTKVLQQLTDGAKGPFRGLKRRLRKKKGATATHRRVVVTRRTVQKLSPRSREKRRMDSKLRSNREKLALTMDKINSIVFDLSSFERMPVELRAVAGELRQLAKQYELDPELRVGALVVLRMINPGILFPSKIGLCEAAELSPEQRRALMLVSKILQCLVNNVVSKDTSMIELSESVLAKWSEKRAIYLNSVCLSPDEIRDRAAEERRIRQEFLRDSFGVFVDISILLRFFLASKGVVIMPSLDPALDVEVLSQPETIPPLLIGKIFFCLVSTVSCDQGESDEIHLGPLPFEEVSISMTDVKICLDDATVEEEVLLGLIKRMQDRIATVRAELGDFDLFGSIGSGEGSNIHSSMTVPFDPPFYLECRDLGIVIHYHYVEADEIFVFCVCDFGYFSPFCEEFVEEVGGIWDDEMNSDHLNDCILEVMQRYNTENHPMTRERAQAYYDNIVKRDQKDIILLHERLNILTPEQIASREKKKRRQ